MIDDFNVNKKDKYCLLFITVFSTILVAYYINFNNSIGIYCSDVYIYLLNSLYYAGKNIHSTGTIYLSPVICFITSLFFKIGFINKFALYIVTGAFAILGNIGFYILLKRYFNETLSLTGTIIYSTCTLYLTWLANGTLDIPASGMTIWIVLFSLIAIKNNPKFYKYLFGIFVIGFFTRYTVILVLPPLLLYYISENGFKLKSKDKKYIKQGLLIGIILSIIILGAILVMGNGHFAASQQISNGISGHQGSAKDPAYNHDESYYLMNLPNFISNSHTIVDGNPILENPTLLSGIIIGILIIGVLLWLYDNKFSLKKKDALPIILAIITIMTFSHVSSIITIILSLLILFLIGKDSHHKTEYFMLAWILTSLIFYSYYTIKVNRYLLPIFPPLIYFILMSITIIHRHININENILPIVLISLFIIQAFAFTLTFDVNERYILNEQISDYIIDNNPDYENMTIGTYNIRPFSWWLGENALGIESSDEKAIDRSNVTYYISDIKLENLTNYTKIKDMSNLYLYKKSV